MEGGVSNRRVTFFFGFLGQKVYNTMYYIVYVEKMQNGVFMLWLSYGYVMVILWCEVLNRC